MSASWRGRLNVRWRSCKFVRHCSTASRSWAGQLRCAWGNCVWGKGKPSLQEICATKPYGIVEVAKDNGQQRVTSIVEKPHPDVAPSTLAVIGRYILTPRIFDKLLTTQPGAGGEIQLTDGIAALLEEEPVLVK
ncbi:hypothetical protein GZH52_10880 [Crenobacter sp. HX-7-9]|uniref:UTP--glucose-1-phosphate uridylyltransferase n=1 Tax=Crenobacter caeni TaxID=2705474 RepID=A0A6B2KTA7_9NEIS|nr:hypothetical protein [Crenobacter caeni]